MEKNNGITVNEGGNEIIFAPNSELIQIPVAEKTVTSEINEDFTLPDYLPEIRRLVCVTPSVSVPSGYTGSDIAEFTGNVVFTVKYVGGDGKLTGFDFSSGFETSVDFDLPDGIDPERRFVSSDDLTVTNCAGRATAPRKLNVKARLEHKITVLGDVNVSADLFGESDPNNVKRLTCALPACRRITAYGDTGEIADVFTVPDGSRVVTVSGVAVIEETAKSAEGLFCRGSFDVCLLYADADGNVMNAEKKIPFTADAAAELPGDGWVVRAYGRSDGVSADISGEEASVRGSVTVFFEAVKNEAAEFTTDVFSTERETALTFREYDVPCLLCCGNFACSHEGSAAFDGLSEDAVPVSVSCRASLTGTDFEKGRITANGVCRYSVVFSDGGEYSCRETELPFKTELCPSAGERSSASCEISASACKIRKEGENYSLSSDLFLSVRVLSDNKIEAVKSADFGREREKRASAFTVAYTSGGDTLWKIAKKYSADPEAVAVSNGIKSFDPDSPDSLKDTKFLII